MKAIMYGAGNIGRGFIGQLLYQSGYETVFIDVNTELVDRINASGRYPIYVTGKEDYIVEWVEGVRAVNGRVADDVISEIVSADIMATALGVNILPRVAPLLARAIEERMKTGKPLNILICENLIGSDKYLRSLIEAELKPEAHDFFENNIGLVSVSVGRVVPPTAQRFLDEDPLAVSADDYSELPADLCGFRPAGAPLPPVKGLLAFSPFQFFIERKLLVHNMGHALIAYLAALRGYEYIADAITDAEIKYICGRAILEAARGLSARHGVALEELCAFCDHLMIRYENKLLIDSVERVGKDTKRKLSPGDRLVGAFKCAKEAGIVPVHIAIGIAAGLHFAPESDAAAIEIAGFTAEHGVAAALEKYCGLTDASDVAMIENFYGLLARRASFAELIDAVRDYIG